MRHNSSTALTSEAFEEGRLETNVRSAVQRISLVAASCEVIAFAKNGMTSIPSVMTEMLLKKVVIIDSVIA